MVELLEVLISFVVGFASGAIVTVPVRWLVKEWRVAKIVRENAVRDAKYAHEREAEITEDMNGWLNWFPKDDKGREMIRRAIWSDTREALSVLVDIAKAVTDHEDLKEVLTASGCDAGQGVVVALNPVTYPDVRERQRLASEIHDKWWDYVYEMYGETGAGEIDIDMEVPFLGPANEEVHQE